MDEEYKWVLINKTYGCFDFSNKFKNIFKERNLNNDKIINNFTSIETRSNEKIIKLVCEIGKHDSNGTYCDFKAIPVVHELISYIRITNHDGLETLDIDSNIGFVEILHKIMLSSNPYIETLRNKEYNNLQIALDKQKEIKNLKHPIIN